MDRRAMQALMVGGRWLPTVSTTQELTYTGSLHYATDEYINAERTHTFYLINGLDRRVGRLNLSASVPPVLQNSEVITLVAAGRYQPTVGDRDRPRRMEQDPALQRDREIQRDMDRLRLQPRDMSARLDEGVQMIERLRQRLQQPS
jgi:hypothetical protein